MAANPAFLKAVKDGLKNVKELTEDQVVERMKKPGPFFLVDVREDLEWMEGFCKGAIHLGKGILERDIEETIPAKNAEIILYCGGGSRSVLAAEAIQKMGYTNVTSMSGGFRGWNAKGYPVEKE